MIKRKFNIPFGCIDVFFISVLFLIFLFYFGLPSLKKYQTQVTLSSEKMIPNDFESPPALTICPMKRRKNIAWKETIELEEKTEDITPKLKEICLARNMSNMTQCVDRMGYGLNETLTLAVTKRSTNLMRPEFWTENLMHFYLPKCFILNLTSGYGDTIETGLMLELNSELDYIVYIHDPLFFFPSVNPRTVPRASLHIGKTGLQFIFIEEILNHMLDQPNKRCRESKEYIFTKCVQSSIRYNTREELFHVFFLVGS